MALTAQKSFASLMRKSYDRQTAVARAKFKLKKGQTEKILANYVNTRSQIALSELIKVLKEYSISDENYLVLIEDASSCVVLIGQDAIMSNFVDAVCAIEWVSRSEDLVELFRQFILHLVTAHSYHCPRVIVSLLKLLKADGENWDEIPPEETVKKWSYIHTIIAEIVAVMPMTCDLLMQMVIEQYPYYKAGCYVNRSYIYNLIWMSKYIPSLQEQLITAIVNRMVTMDVNMTEKSKEKQSVEVFDMELDDDDNDVSTTLDNCMWEVLRWLEDERDRALTIMCNVFEKVMLPTYGTKHVQFLILYTISISQHCADRILTNLWIVAAGLHTLGPGALATRRTAASHLAGLLARCVRVPNTRLVKYLRCMADWCHSYISAAQESTTCSDNNKVHGAFHAICHAIFYLVAFKHKHLFSTRENMNFVESLNLPRLVTCALNPLRTCPPQVTRAFAAATRTHQVAYCQPIIEKNTRHVLHGSKVNFYEWFPYDPYNLPVSGTIIWPLCIEYKDWLKDCSDETQYSGMKRKLDHEDDDFLMSASSSQKLAGSLSNCISPGFRTSESVVM